MNQSPTDGHAALFLDYSTGKLRQLESRIEACLEKLNGEQVWARGAEDENAAGNLVLHLCGNVRQWIVSGVGGNPDIRERDAEFAARGGAAIAELCAKLRATVDEATGILEALPPAQLSERRTIQGYEVSVLEAIYSVVEHFSMHTGQIIFATKAFTGADLGFYGYLNAARSHKERTP
jgi:uncharacterized damage-inducible protein DinB